MEHNGVGGESPIVRSDGCFDWNCESECQKLGKGVGDTHKASRKEDNLQAW